MNSYLKETSCYSTTLLIKHAREHGLDQEVLFDGIEDKRVLLENSNEWVDFETWIQLAKNFEIAGGDLFSAGHQITLNQVSNFQLLILKIAPISLLSKTYGKQFDKSITSLITLRNELKTAKGIWDVYFTPADKGKYSPQVCDFNRGCSLATGQLKQLRNFNLNEIACAARSEAPYCHYQLTWDPAPPLLDRIKEFFRFRFQNQKTILRHMEETHNNLQTQYIEAKNLNEQLMVTLKEKDALSEKLQELNINLEAKVTEQTADIRSKNDSLEKTNLQLRESERMKDLLTGALVHDIKNHLFSMTCDVRAVHSIDGCPDNAQSILRHTASACSSAMSLAANMLDIGKIEEGKLVVEKGPVDFTKMREILDRYTGNVFFSERNIDVQVEPPQFGLCFEADHYLLDRVVQNLLTNAAMYTPKGGKVTISFAAPARVSVFNTGEPIPERYRKTLFEKYARVTPDSSKYAKGLGLFFCKLVMEAHGGNIGLECKEDGNCFVLDFGGWQ